MRLGEDIKGWGAVEFNSGMDEGWVGNEVPRVNDPGRGYLSQPKDETQGWGWGEAMWQKMVESVRLRGEERKN